MAKWQAVHDGRYWFCYVRLRLLSWLWKGKMQSCELPTERATWQRMEGSLQRTASKTLKPLLWQPARNRRLPITMWAWKWLLPQSSLRWDLSLGQHFDYSLAEGPSKRAWTLDRNSETLTYAVLSCYVCGNLLCSHRLSYTHLRAFPLNAPQPGVLHSRPFTWFAPCHPSRILQTLSLLTQHSSPYLIPCLLLLTRLGSRRPHSLSLLCNKEYHVTECWPRR